ncbi:U-box domain-containing protein 4 [Hordeum vulgare]|nr:U-box domain-containing protein 4 [Hordeum vulgare]KAI4968126.1 hypothetical protein ZWY2020_005474 [Hordeum vulgare]
MVLLGIAMEMLPAAVAKSSSANAATAEMLKLSRDFSDYSSFNSDISRKLERLVAAAATPGSDAKTRLLGYLFTSAFGLRSFVLKSHMASRVCSSSS